MSRHQHEPKTVLKFFAPLDKFIQLRTFTDEKIKELLGSARIETKQQYIQLVINATVVGYHDTILPHLPESGAEGPLFDLCAVVNPALEISRVTLPAPEGSSELHLLPSRPTEESGVNEMKRLRHIEADLAGRVIGQQAAVTRVSRAVKKGLAGLRDERRPIATFLFVGQTGVGKTELAKALTDVLYQDAGQLLRVDCSEFGLPHEVAKLIGAPPGYIGHDEGGFLTEALRRCADRVVLFDEIEKSDAKVHDLLLQIVDEGFVTDGKGRRVGFNQAILVLTSNVGSEELEGLRHRIGFRAVEATSAVQSEAIAGALRDRFRPEFINRLSEVVLFNPIGLPECTLISTRMLEEVRSHAASIPLDLKYSTRVPRFLAERGYAPESGARALRRTIEREVEHPLSEMIVDGALKGGDRVTIRVRRNRLQFHRN